MCIICIDLAKGALTAKEGRRALGEMGTKVGAEHAGEVDRKLKEAEANEAKKP